MNYAAMMLNAGPLKRESAPRLLVVIFQRYENGTLRVVAAGKAADHQDSHGVYPILEGPSATNDLYIQVKDYEEIIRNPQHAHMFGSEHLRDNEVRWLLPGEDFVKERQLAS